MNKSIETMNGKIKYWNDKHDKEQDIQNSRLDAIENDL